MPIFNKFYKDSAGEISPAALQFAGAFLSVEVAVPTVLAETLEKAGEPIPPPAEGLALIDSLALIDTGASRTCVHESILTGLGVNPVGVVSTGTAAGQTQGLLYPARLNFPGEHMQVEFGSVIGVDLSGQDVEGGPIIALVGREILGRTLFIYNGAGGFFSICT